MGYVPATVRSHRVTRTGAGRATLPHLSRVWQAAHRHPLLVVAWQHWRRQRLNPTAFRPLQLQIAHCDLYPERQQVGQDPVAEHTHQQLQRIATARGCAAAASPKCSWRTEHHANSHRLALLGGMDGWVHAVPVCRKQENRGGDFKRRALALLRE